MQVLIFGASGSLGSHIVNQALEKGYSVKAFTRDVIKLNKNEHPRLTVFEGDVYQLTDVENSMYGVDAVFCALGDGAKGKVRAMGTLNIIRGMEKAGIKRLICQTTLGIGESWHNLNFFWKHVMFGFLLRKVFQDHQGQEQYIQASDLDYTIVRPSAFTNENSVKKMKIGFDSNVKNLRLKIPRAEIAVFMLKQLDSKDFIRKTVSISE
ncbi:NAD(P)-dependent oxidoreductase [Pleomorphovibrio marinus]|uniref:NAD(P)-dependent oxidoreductase n=1 Tax=Pleomorphovibrio marinus TaxID=2164132 RepID=UPI000E0BF4FB|nr:SDR family oxidoreductase [Pleomorphovibrio marinus]